MSTASRRPQLNSAELLQLKWLLGTLLALLSAWTVPFMDVDAWPALLLITLAAPLVLRWPFVAARLPAWVHWLVFPLLLALALADYAVLRDLLPALVRLTLLLLLYRLVTPRRRRDDMQLIVLGLFLVVVAGVLSVSIAFAVQILAFTGCALLFLLLITLTDPARPEVRAREWTRVGWLPLARRVRAVANWRVLMLGAGLFLGLVAASTALFLLLPRFDLESSLFFDQMMKGRSRTGFSEEVKLGDLTDIQDDTSIAFTVDVSDPSQVPGDLYWRMLVLDSYANGNFSMSNGVRNSLVGPPAKTTRFPGTARLPAGAPVWTFFFEPGVSRYLPLPGAFYQLMFAEPQEVLGNAELRLVALPRPPVKMLAYRVDRLELSPSIPAPGGDGTDTAAPGMMPFYKSQRRPAGSDLAQLAAWVQTQGLPKDNAPEFARRACSWLASRHAYAMQVPASAAGKNDPVVDWMGSNRPGHCEYFAGSFVLLARAAGYSARLVVGFKGGSWNPHSESLVVRNSNAHSWCELYDPRERVWLRVDPTPGANALGDAAGALRGEAALQYLTDHTFSARFDSLRVFWYRHIVSFDQGAQLELSQAVAGQWGAFRAWFRAGLDQGASWLRGSWSAARWSGVAAAGVLLALLVWGGRALRLAWLAWRGPEQVRREAGRWLRRLAGRPATGEGVSAELRAELERLRYGPVATWPDPGRTLGRARRANRSVSK